MGGESRRRRRHGGGARRGADGARGQDTVRLLLEQSASLTLAAQRLLRHHEEQVGVGQSLRVEQPGGGTDRRGVEVLSTPPPRPRPAAPPSGSPPAPGAVAAVDDGVVGGVHRPEVVLGLFHDAAALARLGISLGLRGVCEGPERLSPTPSPWNPLGPRRRSAEVPPSPWGRSLRRQGRSFEEGPPKPYLPAWNQLW